MDLRIGQLFHFNRRLSALLLGLLVLAGGPLRAAYVVNAAAGFDGYVRANRWVPLRFECENTGPAAFEGEFSITLKQGLRSFVFNRPVSLPSPSRKAVTVDIYLGQHPGPQLHWQLLGRGRVVQEGDIGLRAAAADDLLLLAATSRTTGVNLLNGKKLPPSGGEVRLIPYGPGASGNLPDSVLGYEGADAVLWGDIPPASLRPAQIEALQDWVLSGGSLVAWGGAAGDQLQGAWLEPLLPVRLLGQVTLTDQEAFTQSYGFPIDLGAGWVITAAQARPEREAQVLLKESDLDLIVQAPYGLGTVTFLAFDPTSPPFAGWPAAGAFLDYLLTAARIQRREASLGFRPEQYGAAYSDAREQKLRRLQDLVQKDPLLMPPSFRFVSLFLLAYILVVGPVNYLILRYKKKLELTWVTIPIIVLVFLAAEYGLGRHLKGDRIVVNAVELLLGQSGQPSLQHQALFGLFSPAKRKYPVEFDEPQSRVMCFVRSLWREESKETVLRQQERVRIEEHPMNMWTMDLFWAQGRLPLTGAVVCDLKLTPQGISGSVENHSSLALSRPSLFWMGKHLALGMSLPAGETITLDPPIPLENATTGAIPGNFLTRETPSAQERAKALLEFLKETYLRQHSSQVHLLAWAPTLSSGGLRLGDSSFDLRSERLLCLRAQLRREQPTVSIPFGQYACRWLPGEENYTVQPTGGLYFAQGEVVAELLPAAPFSPLQEVTLLNLKVNLSNPASIPLTLEVRDWQQGQWQTLVQRTDQNLNRVFRLAQKEPLQPLHLLRPGDHAMQLRFQVLPKEGTPTTAPTATPTPHGYSPGTMAPGMMGPGMMGPGMMAPGMMRPGMGMMGAPIPARDQVNINRVDLRLEGQAE